MAEEERLTNPLEQENSNQEQPPKENQGKQPQTLRAFLEQDEQAREFVFTLAERLVQANMQGGKSKVGLQETEIPKQPNLMGGGQGSAPATPPLRVKTLEQAAKLAERLFR